MKIMAQRTAQAACMVLAALLLAGCSTVKDTWKQTQEYYQEYIKPTATVDMDDPAPADAHEVRLSQLFTPVDSRMQALYTYMDGQDAMPGPDWVTRLFTLHGWISGLITVDKYGKIIAREPEYSMKPLPLEPLLQRGDAWNKQEVQVYVHDSPLGPEIYIIYPILVDGVWEGLNIAHFDPRKLAEFSPDPGKLIYCTPQVLLWPGDDTAVAEALMQKEWAAILTEDVSGVVKMDGQEFFWIVRYAGQERIIYAALVPESA